MMTAVIILHGQQEKKIGYQCIYRKLSRFFSQSFLTITTIGLRIMLSLLSKLFSFYLIISSLQRGK